MARNLQPPYRRRKKRGGQWRLSALTVDARRFILGIGTVLGLFILMSIHVLPDRVSFSIGDRSPVEIRAPRSVTYMDTEATQRRRENAAAGVSDVYDTDKTALAQAIRSVTELFDRVRRVRSDDSLETISRKVERLASEFGAAYTSEQLRYLLNSPPAALERLQNTARRLVEEAMDQEIRSNTDDLAHVKQKYEESVRRAVSAKTDVALLTSIGTQALRSNLIYNHRKTEHLREQARQSTEPVIGDIQMGDIIIRQDEVFTQLHLDKCTALGLINPSIDLKTGLSIAVLAAAMVFIVGYYIRRALPRLYENPKHLFLLAAITITGVFGLKLFGAMLGIPLSGVQFAYLGMMMVVAAGMLITVLMGPSLAILVTALLSVLSGLLMNHEVRFTVMTLISSLIGIYSVSNIRDRSHLVRATLSIATANVALVWVLGGLLGNTLREVLTGTAWAVISAAFAIAIFWFGIAVLEKPFGILTHVWLLELSSSDRPLLRKLCTTAPGTYAHSIMVGNLAEAAAEAIGADSLFCRVASYYHDIGKMRRPHCFVENQRADNIHDRLNPSLSALIIASHVRDGLQMADQYRLPKQIKDIIAEHHGTSLIRYFYHQALLNSSGAPTDRVLEQHFRYDGPRPQTRESGIIMLADSVEAASRCLEKPTLPRIQSLVETIIHDKLTDGQLDECDLTFKDIQKIQAAFVHLLSAMLHGRVDYPELPSGQVVESVSPEAQRETTYGSLYSKSAPVSSESETHFARRPEGLTS